MRKRARDPNQLGKLVIDIATGEVEDRDPTWQRLTHSRSQLLDLAEDIKQMEIPSV